MERKVPEGVAEAPDCGPARRLTAPNEPLGFRALATLVTSVGGVQGVQLDAVHQGLVLVEEGGAGAAHAPAAQDEVQLLELPLLCRERCHVL